VERRPDNSIVATLAPGSDADAALALVLKSMPNLSSEAQGETLVVRVPEKEIQQITIDAIEQNVGTLRNRINELGVAEPIIQRQGADRVVVQLPGVQDTAQAKRILGATATLEYRGVVEGNAYDALSSGNVPPEGKIYYRKELGPDGKPIPIILNKRVIATGDQLVNARSGYDSRSGTPQVSVTLNGIGGQRMFDFTSENVGKPIAGVEVKIADDGEILVRGENVTRGYFNAPEETRSAFRDGWFHTGDIGELDDGMLRITDRKKDLIKTSGGKYIAPQPIENELKNSRYVTQAVIVGNKRKYASVLIVPNFENLNAWARQQGLPTDDARALIAHPRVQDLYEEVLQKVNAGRPSYETIKKFRLLERDFTIDAGELTPTLKVKRATIEAKHSDLIDTMYEEETPAGTL